MSTVLAWTQKFGFGFVRELAASFPLSSDSSNKAANKCPTCVSTHAEKPGGICENHLVAELQIMMMITFHHYSLKKLALNLVFLFCGLVQCKELLHYTGAIHQILILIMYLCPHNYMSMIEPYLKCMLSQLKQKAKAN